MPGHEGCPRRCSGGADDCCGGAFGAIDRYYRLRFIEGLPEPHAERSPVTDFEIAEAPGERLPGFYEPEIWNGSRFRWCADVAFAETGLRDGSYEFALATIPVGGPLRERLGDLFMDGRPAQQLAIEPDGVTLTGRVEVHGGAGQFQIVSRRLRAAVDDPRPLGLPVCSLRFRRLDSQLASR